MNAPLPPDETQRLEALRRYEILDTPPEQSYDDITLLAAQICQVPMAMVSLVDDKRQWFKSRIGVTAQETARDIAFCAHTILHKDEMLEVRDAETDLRFKDSPLVTSDPHVRFYAGAPLVSPDGHALGALCVMDCTPHTLTEEQREAMRTLGRHVVAQMELRRKSRELENQFELLSKNKQEADELLGIADKSRRALLSVLEDEKLAGQNLRESEERFRQIAENINEVFWMTNADNTEVLYVSPAYEKIWGQSCTSLYESPRKWMEAVHPDDCERVLQAMEKGFASSGFDEEFRIIRPDNEVRWVHDRGTAVRDASGGICRIVGTAQDITDRKRTDESLKLFRSLIDQSNDAVEVVDPETGRFLDFNELACERLGYTREEMLSMSVPDLDIAFPKGSWASVVEKIKKDELKIIEGVNRRKDGSTFPFEVSVRYIHLNRGYIVAVVRDITERKKTEQALQEREERFRQLAENIDEVFWLMNPELNEILYVSPAYEKIWGRPCADLYVSATAWMDPIHPEDRETLHHAWTTKPIEDYNEEYRIIKPDGTIRWVHDRAFPVCDAAGKILRIAGVARDITDTRQAAEQITKQAALLDQTQDAVTVRDLEGRIQFWNKGAEKMFGWTSDEAVGRTIFDLLQEKIPDIESSVDTMLDKGEWSGELQKVAKDGHKLTVEARWTLMRDGRGNPKSILAINTDITEKKKIHAQFLRAQRMESIGTMASGIAHDLNNILAPIMMAVELLKTTSNNPQTKGMLDTLENCAQRGADIVRQVLSFGRGLEAHTGEVQPKHLLKEIQSIIKDTFPKDIQLKFSAEHDGWTIRGDPTQLHQILLNLSVNARDAMPNGGQLTINMENRTLDQQYAAMNPGAKVGDYVLVSVTDTGMGIPRDIVDKIFDPFFTTKEIGKGTGLGLSTVQGIVKSHDGFLNVYSEPGKGTTFRLYFPAITESLGADAQDRVASLPRGNGETVLIVDDEESILSITSETLAVFGYEVLTANNGATAVATYAQHQKKITVVLTDMMMPVMDGRATIHALKQINPAVKIIAASGLTANADAAIAAGVGVKHFLTKPYTAETLLKLLQTVLEKP